VPLDLTRGYRELEAIDAGWRAGGEHDVVGPQLADARLHRADPTGFDRDGARFDSVDHAGQLSRDACDGPQRVHTRLAVARPQHLHQTDTAWPALVELAPR